MRSRIKLPAAPCPACHLLLVTQPTHTVPATCPKPQCAAERQGAEPLSVSYRYFPGAADDEESWSNGLSPPLMWCHLRTLLAAGPSGIEAAARQLVEQAQLQQGQQQQHAAAEEQEGRAAGVAAPRPGLQADVQQPQKQPQPEATGAAVDEPPTLQPPVTAAASCPWPPTGSRAAAALHSQLQQPADSGLHCLLPQGCRPAQAAAVQRVGAGMFLLGSTRLAISSGAAAAAPSVWQHADAVLHLGSSQVAGMEQEMQPGQRQHKLHDHQQLAHGQQQPQDLASDAGQPSSTHTSAPASSPSPAACRYCWLPVRCAKQDRHSLQQRLPAALRFAASQLEQGRRLLVSCDSGLDASVCAALACLLAFYWLDLQPGGGTGLAYVGPAAAAAASKEGPTDGSGSSACDGSLDSSGGGIPPACDFPPLVGQAGFSKLAVRQHLAALTAHYPAARPTRGSIKQVYNFFLGQLGGSAADDA